MKYTLSKIAEITDGRLYGDDREVEHITIDSREVGLGSQYIFIALATRRRDGHSHIFDASEKGIRAFMVERVPHDAGQLGSFVVVDDTVRALQRWAQYHRQTFTGEVVAITGSNGKTTVKEWFSQVWRGGKMYRSPRSYNSQVGVPLSVLMASGDEDVVVIEVGISMVGEMSRLRDVVQPTIGVITNIGDAHSENFDSTSEKLCEKLSLFEGLSSQRIIRGDLHHSATMVEHNLWIVGEIYRLLGVEALLGRDPMPLSLRLEVQSGLYDSVVINDSYSNDLVSLRAALDFAVRESAGRPLRLIVTDIEQSAMSGEALYAELMDMVREGGVERMVGVGAELKKHCAVFEGVNAEFFDTTEELLESIRPSQYGGGVVLIKGARSYGLERVSARLEERTHTTILEVNLSKVVENYRHYEAMCSPTTRVMAMVKASGYGLGGVEVGRALLDSGVSCLAVAYVDEGITLRRGGISAPIVVLNAELGAYRAMLEYSLEPEIYSIEGLRLYVEEVQKSGMSGCPIHIKIDTGMHRLGFTPEQISLLNEELMHRCGDAVRVATIFSHLAAADDPAEDDFTRGQIALFDSMSAEIISSLGYAPLRSLANSAGVARFAEAHYDIVRLGIGLYLGASTLSTKIAQIKRVSAGSTIGYNRRGIANRDMTIAVLPIGYADGLSRALSCGVGEFLVGGLLCPIVGNVCMDSVMIDVSKLSDRVKVGDRVVVMGGGALSETEIARRLNTISYEVLTSISPRIKRLTIW